MTGTFAIHKFRYEYNDLTVNVLTGTVKHFALHTPKSDKKIRTWKRKKHLIQNACLLNLFLHD
jgi:hypothetical protein